MTLRAVVSQCSFWVRIVKVARSLRALSVGHGQKVSSRGLLHQRLREKSWFKVAMSAPEK